MWEEKLTHYRRPSHRRGQWGLKEPQEEVITEKFNTEIMLDGNGQLRTCLHVHAHLKHARAGCGGMGCYLLVLRGRIGVECHEDTEGVNGT